MSGNPALFVRPVLTFDTGVTVAVLEDKYGNGEETLRMISLTSFSIFVLLDSLAKEYANGRSFTDDQHSVYRSIEKKVNDTYGLDGRGCLLRFICELQKFPIKDWTVMGELITAVFTPKGDSRDLLKEYPMAQRKGEEEDPDSCVKHFAASCPISIFNFFQSNDYLDQQFIENDID